MTLVSFTAKSPKRLNVSDTSLNVGNSFVFMSAIKRPHDYVYRCPQGAVLIQKFVGALSGGARVYGARGQGSYSATPADF